MRGGTSRIVIREAERPIRPGQNYIISGRNMGFCDSKGGVGGGSGNQGSRRSNAAVPKRDGESGVEPTLSGTYRM